MSDPLALSGVELRRHDDSTYPVCDDDFEPYAHQQALRDCFETKSSFLAVNDSPTGGGKTMSWLAPIVERGEHALAVYPTNALIEDQRENIEQEIDETLESGSDTNVLTVTSDSLRTKYADEFPNADTNGERLLALLRDRIERSAGQVLVLTNPDIFVMMRRNLYGREHNPGARIRPLNEIGTIVVDEFHRAGRKEQNTLLFLLDEMYDVDERYCALSRIVLLSATPTERLERRFENAMSAPYTRVTEQETDEQRPFDNSPANGWYPVMPPVDLDVRSAPTFGTADELLADDWNATREFAARDGKTVFILDGIHEVDRVYHCLDDALDERNVVRIDGFHHGDLEEKIHSFDVLVSNSAVEVGIDFTVDRLVFSAHNQSSFLQRLGRLRTESGIREARCYVPSNVETALDDLPRSDRHSRPSLVETLSSAYHDPRNVESFDWRYSAAEAYYHVLQRTWNSNAEEKERVQDDGWQRITRHFGDEHDLTRSNVERRVDVIKRAIEKTLQWYRGSSLQALVYDRTADADERIKTYNLFYLLRYGDVTFYPRSEFLRSVVPDEHTADAEHVASFVEGYCTYDGTIDTENEYGRDVTLEATAEALDWLKNGNGAQQKTRKPRFLSTLSINVDVEDGGNRIASLEHLRDELSDDLDILCYAVDASPGKAKNQYKLGPFFFLYELLVAGEGCKSVALGTDALYLHCLDEGNREGPDLEQFGIDF